MNCSEFILFKIKENKGCLKNVERESERDWLLAWRVVETAILRQEFLDS